MNVKDVKVLNERIEMIQTKRTKAEARKEMLMARLRDEISKYEETYGVKLTGTDFESTIKLILAEKERVSKDISDEYNLKLKVVNAIENGNISEANELLGISNNIADTQSVVQDVNNGTTVDEANVSEDYNQMPEDDEEPDDYEEVSKGISIDDLDFGDFGVVDDDSEANTEEDDESTDESDYDDFDDFDNDDTDEGSFDSEDLDVQTNNKNGTSNAVEDDEDLGTDDFDFGFGDMLKGSKLDI